MLDPGNSAIVDFRQIRNVAQVVLTLKKSQMRDIVCI